MTTDTNRRAARSLELAEKHHPELSQAERAARLKLVGAINAWDALEDLIADGAVTGRHTLQEQAAVNQATSDYAQALANLLRGEDPNA